MNGTDLISLTVDGAAARLLLKRPPLNMLNLEMLRRMEERLEAAAREPGVRALILDTEAPSFCAGFEPSELTRESVFLLLEQFHHTARLLCNFPFPTIALVRGMALGAGNEMAACCDFIFATEKASFGQPEIKIGIIPSLAPMLLPPLIGQRAAEDMILTGKFLGAKDAERVGLVTRVLPDAQLSKAAEELVDTFSTLSGAVIQVCLKSLRSSRMHEWDRHQRDVESLYLNELMDLEDAVEGVRAFVEKRPPKWKHH